MRGYFIFVSINYLPIIFYAMAVVVMSVLQIYMINSWLMQDEDDRAQINGYLTVKVLKKHYKF